MCEPWALIQVRTRREAQFILPPLGDVEDGGSARERSKMFRAQGTAEIKKWKCEHLSVIFQRRQTCLPSQSTNHPKAELAGS